MFYRLTPWIFIAATIAAAIGADCAWHALNLANVPAIVWLAAGATCVTRTTMKLGAALMH
jgi:hypothetical protein